MTQEKGDYAWCQYADNGKGDVMTRRQETQNIKEALHKAGYEAESVKHGTGTGWSWITVRMLWGSSDGEASTRRVYQIVREVSHRQDWYDDKILVV